MEYKIFKKYLPLPLLLIISIYININGSNYTVIGKYIDTLTTFIFLLSISNSNIIKNKIGKGFLLIISLVCSIELSFRIIFDEKISVFVLRSILETNAIESRRMLHEYVHYFFIATIPLLFVFFFAFKHGKVSYIKNKHIIITLFFLITLTILKQSIYEDRYLMNLKENPVETISRNLHDRISFFIGDISYALASSIENPKYSNINDIEDIDNSIIGVKDGHKNVVLIIGESSRRDHYGLYGYNINTTPMLSKTLNKSNSCIIKYPHSAAAVTRDSIAMMLSFHTPEDEEKLFKKKSVIELAKHNGYYTSWLGSQPLKGLYDSKFGFIAKKSNSINLTDGNDNLLPQLLKDTIDKKNNKNFIVIHLLGSHIPYNNYDSHDAKSLGNVHPYDLTIHHTDKIIYNIINLLNHNLDDYILVYTSDHGEEIDKGHGFLTGQSQYDVPFFLYSNKKENLCNEINKYTNNETLSSLMDKYIISELLGYTVDEKSILLEKNNDRVLKSDGSVIKYKDLN
jgi:heptose-I-phosphate ethanolaminephosphotransferase